MQQAKFSLTTSLLDFVKEYRRFGFKDRSAMVRAALESLQEALTIQSLNESAAMYAELYDADDELRMLTEAAVTDWPE